MISRADDGASSRDSVGPSGPRDANGVAVGADVAVDRAAASAGQPLPGALQRRFESSLGADLAGVRVHTGAESAQAAHAAGAKAYATGSDIHFAAGAYQPDDPFGMHLLAHEVAHTVQQSGGQATRQHKLEVSGPADSAEVEADRAADAMVVGAPFSVGSTTAPLHRAFDDAFESGGFGGDSGGGEAPAHDGPPPLSGRAPSATPPGYQHRSDAIERGVIKGTIYFATDDATVRGDDLTAIDKIIARYGQQIESGDYRVEIVGYADQRADDGYNKALATRRGDAVADQLNNRLPSGLPGETTCDAVGEVPSSNHVDHLAHNRRVEIRLIPVERPSYPMPNLDPPAPSPGWQPPPDWSTEWELRVDAGAGVSVPIFKFIDAGVETALLTIKNVKNGETRTFTYTGVGVGKSAAPVSLNHSGGPYPFTTSSPVPIRIFASIGNSHVQAGAGVVKGVAADCWILTGPRQAGADVAVVNASGIGDVAADVGGGGTVGPIF